MSRLSCLFVFCIFFIPRLIFPEDTDINDTSKSVYELIRVGSIEELRAECRRRGISDEGDQLTLRRRLLNHELESNIISFDERVSYAEEKNIILNHSDFIEHKEDENGDELAFLRGNVDIVYGEKKIQADEVKINIDTGIITGSGNVTFIDSGKKYLAERFFYNINTEEGIFFYGKTYLRKFMYTGKTIRKIDEKEKYVADDVSITTCNIKHPHYHVEAGKLFYYDNDFVLIENASFYFGNDVLFSLPYYYRSMEEPDVKSAIYFRDRAGLVLQNTYYPLKTDERLLVLKGDLYERLGIYTGLDFSTYYSFGETSIGASATLANDVYYYDYVTEKWSPYGPPDADVYSVNRSLRYKVGAYQKFQYGDRIDNTTEINFYWARDPYYAYDFERRGESFDIFKLIQQAESDYPRKDSGFSWYVNHHSYLDSLSASVLNSVRFIPQRNMAVDTVYLSNYYEYRIYTVTAPNVTLSHSDTILDNIQPVFISNLDYSSYANYNHTAYYDEYGVLSSDVHRGSTHLNLKKAYQISDYIKFTPEVEAGAEGQQHIDPEESELLDDNKHTLIYGKTGEDLRFGRTDLNIELSHNLKYKLFGPDDYYTYGRFREHNLGLRGYAAFWKVTEEAYTSYDLRPTYDWQEGMYDPFVFDGSHFSPFVNIVTFTPVSGIILSDKFVYDISNSRPKTNSFILDATVDDIYIEQHKITMNWYLDWEHNFINPLFDNLRSIFEVDMKFYRYLTLYFSIYSRNDNLWLYFPEIASEHGREAINPIVDLLKSFNFFNVEDRKSSQFKMKSISFGLVRELHDWLVRFDYTGNREISYDGSRYLWNNTYSISIGLKEVEDVHIHTTFSEKH